MSVLGDLLAATDTPAMLRHVARGEWATAPAHPGAVCPADGVPAPDVLAAWLPECPAVDRARCMSRIDAIAHVLMEAPEAAHLFEIPRRPSFAAAGADRSPALRWTAPAMEAAAMASFARRWLLHAPVEPGWFTPTEHPDYSDWDGDGDPPTVAVAPFAERLHSLWLIAREHEPDLKHPLGPLVAGWQDRAPDLGAGTVTVTRATDAGAGMTRRAALVSTLRRAPWRPDDGGPDPLVTGAVVDGEPMAAPRPDTADLFPVRKRRSRRRFKPGEQRTLALPVVPPIPHDLRLVALADLAGDPILQGDVLALLGFAWAADRPLVLTERAGAALLARARDGRPRTVQPQHDVPRFWETAYALRALVAWEPGPNGEPGAGWRWADLATVEVPAVRPVDRATVGPPAWARPMAGKWTLTAEASAASVARAVSGQHGLAGRIITGIEYRLAAGFTGRPNSVAPDLRPAGRSKASAGPVVELDWRTCLRLAGDWWDEADPAADNAARVRFNRAVATLRRRGYFVASLRAEAPAGDSVEIVGRIAPARGRPGGLMVRASARFVEAARLAQLPNGRGFETRKLVDWAGLRLPEGDR